MTQDTISSPCRPVRLKIISWLLSGSGDAASALSRLDRETVIGPNCWRKMVMIIMILKIIYFKERISLFLHRRNMLNKLVSLFSLCFHFILLNYLYDLLNQTPSLHISVNLLFDIQILFLFSFHLPHLIFTYLKVKYFFIPLLFYSLTLFYSLLFLTLCLRPTKDLSLFRFAQIILLLKWTLAVSCKHTQSYIRHPFCHFNYFYCYRKNKI